MRNTATRRQDSFPAALARAIMPWGMDMDRPLPTSAYRLQFNQHFGFRDAAALTPYLSELGVSTVYCSPYFAAAPGSTHGYDVVDYRRLNPELGDVPQFDRFCAALKRSGLGQIIDMVPNHMGISDGNRLWLDVMENGQASPFARFFDINWEPVKSELKNRVLIPILGDLYGVVLENGEIRLEYAEGRFQIRYGAQRLPLAPETYPLTARLDDLKATLGEDKIEFVEYLSIATALARLPPREPCDGERTAERAREKEVAKKRLAELARRSPAVQNFLTAAARRCNGTRGESSSFDELDDILSRQVYRMAYWMAAADEINYRRFFYINQLAAIRIEDPQVFAHCHELVFRLIREGKVIGLRIDHPDGLYDPTAYFQRLRQRSLEAAAAAGTGTPLIIAEKILDRKENLPQDWQVDGTVGYDFLNALNGLFIDQDAEKSFSSAYEDFIGHALDFDETVYDKKKMLAALQMSSEIQDLGYRLDRISERNRRYRDFTRHALVLAVRETIACFPVYRTYIAPSDKTVSERDEKYIHDAIEKAKSRTPTAINPAVYDFLRDVLLLRLETRVGPEERQLYRDFVMRFQQLTAPIMAKGLEDTAFYVYNRLLSLNEVGGDPPHFGVSREDFHRQNSLRAKSWPRGFLTGSTHDTKRSEDVRMRLNSLSEIPEEWRAMLARWSLVNRKHKTLIAGDWEPRPNTEILIYQTLLGMWPDAPPALEERAELRRRLWQFVEKAIREAKVHTDWLHPDPEYENAVRRFVDAILDPEQGRHFTMDFIPELRRVADAGRWNSLSALTLRLASPGIMDVYQGTELWDYSLVDPDNRRPVDYALRRRMLLRLKARVESGESPLKISEELLNRRADGRIKLYLLWRGLRLRRRAPSVFIGGEYAPLVVTGAREKHVVAFLRRDGGRITVAAAARFFLGLKMAEGEIGRAHV
jgi:(1->4)-alpha-D-glucan 1-alpha-D-glucosylmutase